jgi:hypothetical protein
MTVTRTLPEPMLAAPVSDPALLPGWAGEPEWDRWQALVSVDAGRGSAALTAGHAPGAYPVTPMSPRWNACRPPGPPTPSPALVAGHGRGRAWGRRLRLACGVQASARDMDDTGELPRR